jgi:hypothetical protein
MCRWQAPCFHVNLNISCTFMKLCIEHWNLLKWRTKLCKINFRLEWNLRTSYNVLWIPTASVCASEEGFMSAVLCGVSANHRARTQTHCQLITYRKNLLTYSYPNLWWEITQPLIIAYQEIFRFSDNHLKTKRRPLYLKTQSVPRCKHFISRA